MEEDNWRRKLLDLVESHKPSTYFSLNDIAFERIKECQTKPNGLISTKNLYLKLCRCFSIKKTDCKKLLNHFETIGKIKILQRGIQVLD